MHPFREGLFVVGRVGRALDASNHFPEAKAAQDAVDAAAQAKADKARLKLPTELLARDKAIADLVEESYKRDADEPISLELTRLITECHLAELNLYTSRAFPLTAKARGHAKRD